MAVRLAFIIFFLSCSYSFAATIDSSIFINYMVEREVNVQETTQFGDKIVVSKNEYYKFKDIMNGINKNKSQNVLWWAETRTAKYDERWFKGYGVVDFNYDIDFSAFKNKTDMFKLYDKLPGYIRVTCYVNTKICNNISAGTYNEVNTKLNRDLDVYFKARNLPITIIVENDVDLFWRIYQRLPVQNMVKISVSGQLEPTEEKYAILKEGIDKVSSLLPNTEIVFNCFIPLKSNDSIHIASLDEYKKAVESINNKKNNADLLDDDLPDEIKKNFPKLLY